MKTFYSLYDLHGISKYEKYILLFNNILNFYLIFASSAKFTLHNTNCATFDCLNNHLSNKILKSLIQEFSENQNAHDYIHYYRIETIFLKNLCKHEH